MYKETSVLERYTDEKTGFCDGSALSVIVNVFFFHLHFFPSCNKLTWNCPEYDGF